MSLYSVFGRTVLVGLMGSLAATLFATSPSTIPGSVLPVLSQSQVLGSPPLYQTVYVTVSLKPRFPAEMKAMCDSVSNPRSDMYRHWMTPTQVGLQFGATSGIVSNTVAYLKSKGLKITLTAPNRMAILCEGTVAQVQSAFGTTIKNYRGPGQHGGQITFQANSTALKMPASLVPYIQAVSGIQNWLRPTPLAQTQELTPTLYRGLYNVKAGYLLGFQGQGRTVGVSNWDGFSITDNVPLFYTTFGLPTPPGGVTTNIQVVTVQGGSQNNVAQGEGDLDIQMELSSAPLATEIVYDGGGDEISVLAQEASDNLCDVISESWIWGYAGFPSEATAAHNQHLAMSLQGITYLTATGDDGTATYTDFAGGYPQCEPEVLGVGGTTATVDSVTGSRIDEVTWTGSGAGGGGWVSEDLGFNTRPIWQHGPGIPTSPNKRLQPDIAAHAGNVNFNCYDFFSGGAPAGANGTSFASPVTAGSLLVVGQRLESIGITPRLGRVQDLIYFQAGRTDVYHDITQGGSIGGLPDGQQALPLPGWDFCTGWGTFDYDGLYNSLVQISTATPYYPDGIGTVVGDYLIGDVPDVAASDDIYYQVASVGIPQFGQAAGAAVSFTIPEDSVAITIDLQTNGGLPGGTNMVWLFNNFTQTYDLVGATPMNASGSDDRILKVKTSKVAAYIGSGGTVNMIIRGHYPIKPFSTTLPVPFTYKIDFLELLVR